MVCAHFCLIETVFSDLLFWRFLLLWPIEPNRNTVKPVFSGHSKIAKTKVLKTNGSLMKVESIAECSLGAFCDTCDLH